LYLSLNREPRPILKSLVAWFNWKRRVVSMFGSKSNSSNTMDLQLITWGMCNMQMGVILVCFEYLKTWEPFLFFLLLSTKISILLTFASSSLAYLKFAWFMQKAVFGIIENLAYQGKDIVFRSIIEYSSLRDFGP